MNADRVIIALFSGWIVFTIAIIVVAFTIEFDRDPPPTVYVRPTPLPVEPTPTPGPRVGPTAADLRSRGLDVLPPVTMPDDNPLTPAKTELGKILFFDRRLSGNGVVACATCHLQNVGWGDGNALSLGYPGTLHWRNSQTIINTAYQSKLFWGGEKTSLESQASSSGRHAASTVTEAPCSLTRAITTPAFPRTRTSRQTRCARSHSGTSTVPGAFLRRCTAAPTGISASTTQPSRTWTWGSSGLPH